MVKLYFVDGDEDQRPMQAAMGLQQYEPLREAGVTVANNVEGGHCRVTVPSAIVRSADNFREIVLNWMIATERSADLKIGERGTHARPIGHALQSGAIYNSSMPARSSGQRGFGDVVALRYITSDGRIEICWPCRVVKDGGDLLALFIAAGSPYKAGPKKSAAEKRRQPRTPLPPDEYVWRNDTLRLMFPGRSHSVSLSWSTRRASAPRRLLKYFVNMEEPFRRTAVGFDTQDHTLDIEVTPDLAWHWRDEQELANHVTEGFYTAELAIAARSEGQRAIEAIQRREHECVRGWPDWSPPPEWQVAPFAAGWDTTPPTFWDRRDWAYSTAP